MRFGQIRTLEEVEVDKNYYLYHKDETKPEPYINFYIKVIRITEEEVVVRKNSYQYFVDRDKNNYEYLVFRKRSYGCGGWYLK